MEVDVSMIIGYVLKFNYALPYNASYLTDPYVRYDRSINNRRAQPDGNDASPPSAKGITRPFFVLSSTRVTHTLNIPVDLNQRTRLDEFIRRNFCPCPCHVSALSPACSRGRRAFLALTRFSDRKLSIRRRERRRKLGCRGRSARLYKK